MLFCSKLCVTTSAGGGGAWAFNLPASGRQASGKSRLERRQDTRDGEAKNIRVVSGVENSSAAARKEGEPPQPL